MSQVKMGRSKTESPNSRLSQPKETRQGHPQVPIMLPSQVKGYLLVPSRHKWRFSQLSPSLSHQKPQAR